MAISIVLGSFFGDEGKGQCVNNLCKGKGDLVVRFSGANQVGHNVKHDNLTHCFRNFGSGTLKGARTYWHNTCLCDFYTANDEYNELVKIGCKPVIFYNPNCEIIIPADVQAQRSDEENRKHGTCGYGFKKALDRIKAGWSVTVTDAKNKIVLEEKILNIYRFYYKMSYDRKFLDEWMNIVNTYANEIALYKEFSELLMFDNIIFEGSQGILLDQKHGIMPYCTPSNTTSKNAIELLRDNDLFMPFFRTYYVCRPCITRHGNGPMLTDKPYLDIIDENNPTNEFQGTLRAREFDTNLLKHSIAIDDLYNHTHNKTIMFSNAGAISENFKKMIQKEFSYYDIEGFEYEEKVKLC